MVVLQSRAILVVSPHSDDAVLSCSGLLAQSPDALVVTVCGSGSPELVPWLGDIASPSQRRVEDHKAMTMLGCASDALGVLDAPWRCDEVGQPLYPRFSALFGNVRKEDEVFVQQIYRNIKALSSGRIVVVPRGIGNHVDHQIANRVGHSLAQDGCEVYSYEDAPYCFSDWGKRFGVSDTPLQRDDEIRVPFDVESKCRLVACYESQVRGLFGSINTYREHLLRHLDSLGDSVECYWPVS